MDNPAATAATAQSAVDLRDNPNSEAAWHNAEAALANARNQGATPEGLEAAAELVRTTWGLS